jgi:hypothetical protein
VSGDVILNGPFTAEDGYELSADGDTSISLPAADVRLVLRAGGRIRSDVTLTPADGSPTYTAVLGGSTYQPHDGGDMRVAQAGARPGAGAQRRVQLMRSPICGISASGSGNRSRRRLRLRGSRRETARFRPAANDRARPVGDRAKSATAEGVSAQNRWRSSEWETGAISPEEADILLKALEA